MPELMSLSTLAIALLSALPAAQAGMYPKSSAVLQVDAKDYDRLVAKSNHTTIMEFYAPWCGHCKNLMPTFEKVAKNLEGLAHVAAMDCDHEANKPFCGTMGIQGFPTLKIIRPSLKPGKKSTVSDYQGPRTAKDMVDKVVEEMNNHVKKVTDKDLDDFLSDDKPKALLFTEKGATSSLLKSLAIDFLDVIPVGQVRSNQAKAVEKFGIEKFPSLVLIPGDKDFTLYDGPLKKPDMVKFLSQAGSPNPDPAPAAAKKPKKQGKSKAAKPSAKTSTEEAVESETTSTPEEQQTAPVIIEQAPPIPEIHTQEKLVKECLHEKAHTCVLALIPSDDAEGAKAVAENLAELAYKHAQSKRKLFPFFILPESNTAAATLRKALGLGDGVELVAVNARRDWWRQYEGEGALFTHEGIETWIDAIRMSEGTKKKLPEGVVAASAETAEPSPEASSEPTPDATESVSAEEATPVTPEAETDSSVTEEDETETKAADPTPEADTESDSSVTEEETETKAADPTPEAETGVKHEEL